MKIKVRPVKLEDALQVIKLCRTFQQTCLAKNQGFSEKKIMSLVLSALKDEMFCWVIEENEKLIGYMMGTVGEFYFSDKLGASDLGVYIKPNKRRHAFHSLKILFAQFEEWAKSKGAIEVSVATSSGTASTGYEKFLLRYGYEKIGYITQKEF